MDLGGYEGLKSAKAALDSGLIAEVDYEEVKVAYLRAQQIRAGLDAGFIKENDYQNIKRAFLNSLNLADPSFGAGIFICSYMYMLHHQAYAVLNPSGRNQIPTLSGLRAP